MGENIYMLEEKTSQKYILLSGENMKVSLSVSLDVELGLWVKNEAEKRGMTISEYVGYVLHQQMLVNSNEEKNEG